MKKIIVLTISILLAAMLLALAGCGAGGQYENGANEGSGSEADPPSRDQYISNPSLMKVNWDSEWQPPSEMLDYRRKVDTLTRKNKRTVFTVSHRGDFLHYPENSIEAMISFWAMGGDCVEIDVRYTKDGIPVIMHDKTLGRMTDFDEKAGKNGLPKSNKIANWTLEQLRELRLREGQGGEDAEVTDYLIPTLEECLIASKGRFFLLLDKQALWQYVEIPSEPFIQALSEKNYIQPLMEKTGNYSSVLIAYGTIDETEDGTLDADEALTIQKYIYDNFGGEMYIYLRGWISRGTAEPYAKTLSKGTLTNSGVIVEGAFHADDDAVNKEIYRLCKKYPDTMFGGWTIDDINDNPEVWRLMYKIGMRSLLTNNTLELVKFAAKADGYA